MNWIKPTIIFVAGFMLAWIADTVRDQYRADQYGQSDRATVVTLSQAVKKMQTEHATTSLLTLPLVTDYGMDTMPGLTPVLYIVRNQQGHCIGYNMETKQAWLVDQCKFAIEQENN